MTTARFVFLLAAASLGAWFGLAIWILGAVPQLLVGVAALVLWLVGTCLCLLAYLAWQAVDDPSIDLLAQRRRDDTTMFGDPEHFYDRGDR